MTDRTLQITVDGQTYTTRRWAEGNITITDSRGEFVELTWNSPAGEETERKRRVILAAHDAHIAADRNDDAADLAAALAPPTAKELADEAHARRWARATNDPDGNY